MVKFCSINTLYNMYEKKTLKKKEKFLSNFLLLNPFWQKHNAT
jgi:hypothetical protein